MSLQLILGGSGSGKTEYLYGRIVQQAQENPGKNYLVIVPEQFTMQTQQKLVDLAKNHCIMNIDVLSFKRLAYRVFDDLGMGDVQVLEETGKNLVLRRLAQQKKEELTVLAANMNRMGYIGEVKSLISELVQYRISPEKLLEIVEDPEIPQALAAKLRDVATMYRAFREYEQGSFVTAEEILNVLKELTPRSQTLRNAVLAFDEFTGFTPIQNDLMHELLLVADKIYITLTIGASEDFYHSTGREELFDLSKRTIAGLVRMAGEADVSVEEPVVLTGGEKKRFKNAPALFFMEQNLFRARPREYEGEVREIHLASAHDPQSELTLVARTIQALIRKGSRFREIAVVTGSVETYRSFVAPVFSRYEIPYFMDTTKEVLFHPFIEMIRAALEIVESNFSYEALMRFLRCGFCGIEEDALDRLDNYLLASGVRGRTAWTRKWKYAPRRKSLYDMEQLEEIRIRVCDLLLPFADAFSADAVVSDGIRALYTLLVRMDAAGQLAALAERQLAVGEEIKAQENTQIYKIVMQLLEKYHMLLGEEPLNIQEFTEVLEAGMSAADVAVIPPGYDSVTIGDIERTRLNHVKILFFIGVNDGIIPKSAGAGGIISEYERQRLSKRVELAPAAREQAFIQRFYLYRSLTKPSEELYVSFSKVDSEGKALRPSYLVGVLRRLFPGLSLRETENLSARKDFYTKAAAPEYLINGEHDDDWYALAHWLLEHDDGGNTGALLRAPYTRYEGEPISRAVALALYGTHPLGSITRLERFAACAYAHFLRYGLRLSERETGAFENVDMGNIYHAALESYSRGLGESEYDWFSVPDDVRRELAETSMREALNEYGRNEISLTDEEEYRKQRMFGVFDETVWALTQQVRAGKFIPEYFEVTFEELEGAKGLSYRLTREARMNLTGRIDRLDVYHREDNNKIAIKIIDYKSGKQAFELIRVYRGLQLQLAVYMDAAQEFLQKRQGADVEPGGVLYYHIDDPVLESEEPLTEEEAKEKLLLSLRPDGLVNADEELYRAMDADFEGKSSVIPVELKKDGQLSARSQTATSEEFAIITGYVRQVIRQCGRSIYEGDVRVNPYRDGQEESCSYCPYASVCGFDPGIEGYRYRHFEPLKKEEVLEKMETSLRREEGKKDGMDVGTAESH